MAYFEAGRSYRQIGEALGIASETARAYVNNVQAYRTARRATG